MRQAIADSWPRSMDDSAAREEWGWRPTFELDGMIDDMLEKLGGKLLAHRGAGARRGRSTTWGILMPTDRIHGVLAAELAGLSERGTAKREESVITHALPPAGGRGPRVRLAGEG